MYILYEQPNIFIFFLFIFFFFLFFFYIIRFYFDGPCFSVAVVMVLLLILWQYYILYYYFIKLRLELTIQLTNFSLGLGFIDINLLFKINTLSYFFSLLVFIIALGTNITALNYFKNEADEMGFLFWLNFFVLSMVLLVMSNNFFTIFLGWELIGLTSFFLINFWQVKRSTLKSSFKAFTFNLVSDLFLLIFFMILYRVFGITNVSTLENILLNNKSLNVNSNEDFKIALYSLIICSSIKSVQFIGHLWLPDSMEAPVPASALIHSATLVSAGIFLLLKFKFLLQLGNCLNILITLGSFTAAYGGVVASSQTDVKKLLAYSTMSHCGFLYILVGFSDEYITITYLFLHGLFKALTFHCVGSFIRLYGTQDTRLMGGAAQLYWADSLYLLFCSANLCGLPITVGYLYKILFFKILFLSHVSFLNIGFIFIGLLSSIIYFFRLNYYCLFDRYKMIYGVNPSLKQAFRAFKPANRFYKYWFYKEYRDESKISTKAQFIYILGTLVFIYYMYLECYYYNLYNIHHYKFLLYNNINSNIHVDFIKIFYKTYLVYFYTIYTIIVVLIVLITWRKNIFFFQTIYFYFYILISIIYLFLICEGRSLMRLKLRLTLTLHFQPINQIY